MLNETVSGNADCSVHDRVQPLVPADERVPASHRGYEPSLHRLYQCASLGPAIFGGPVPSGRNSVCLVNWRRNSLAAFMSAYADWIEKILRGPGELA